MSTADRNPTPDPLSLQWSATMARAIAAERRRLRKLVEAHRANVERLRAAFIEQFEKLSEADRDSIHQTDSRRAHDEPSLARIDTLLRETRDSAAAARQVSSGVHETFGKQESVDKPAAAPRERSVPAESSSPSKPVGSKLDWEAQKRQMLASLESDGEIPAYLSPAVADDEDELDRLTIEGAISITDDVIAEKDRLIAKLQKQLVERTEAASQSSLDDLLNSESSDEGVLEDRQRVLQMQNELEEKMRMAEMQLSRERAELARARAEIDQQKRDLDDQRSTIEKDIVVDSPNAAGNKKQPRGRWLARLGLKENGDDDTPKS